MENQGYTYALLYLFTEALEKKSMFDILVFHFREQK
jgi:hypothetical protein